MRKLLVVPLSLIVLMGAVSTSSGARAEPASVPNVPGVNYDVYLNWIVPGNPWSGAETRAYFESSYKTDIDIHVRIYKGQTLWFEQEILCSSSRTCYWPGQTHAETKRMLDPGDWCVFATFTYYDDLGVDHQETIVKTIFVAGT